MTPFQIMAMSGISAPQVHLPDEAASTNTQPCSYQLLANGAGRYSTSNTTTASFTWLLTGLNSDYQVNVSASGSAITGTTGSWLSLSSNRTWTLSTVGGSTTLTVQIRRVSDLKVIATAVVTLDVFGANP